MLRRALQGGLSRSGSSWFGTNNGLSFKIIFPLVAQSVEQLIRNEQVVGSSPIGGSVFFGVVLPGV